MRNDAPLYTGRTRQVWYREAYIPGGYTRVVHREVISLKPLKSVYKPGYILPNPCINQGISQPGYNRGVLPPPGYNRGVLLPPGYNRRGYLAHPGYNREGYLSHPGYTSGWCICRVCLPGCVCLPVCIRVYTRRGSLPVCIVVYTRVGSLPVCVQWCIPGL